MQKQNTHFVILLTIKLKLLARISFVSVELNIKQKVDITIHLDVKCEDCACNNGVRGVSITLFEYKGVVG